MIRKCLWVALGLLLSTSVFAAADHFIRKEGGLVQHLKIIKQKDEVNVLVDVDFEPTGNETGRACSADISGEVKVINENELVLKRQAQGEAHYCELKIHLSDDEARIDESKDCVRYFSGDRCRFGSEGKALIKIK